MLTRIWTRKEHAILLLLTTIWLGLITRFWLWWFKPEHIGTHLGFALTSLAIAWPIFLFLYAFYFIIKMQTPNPLKPITDNISVAMVITKAPSEPLSVVQKTLKGALNQKYPHDTWIADEDPTPEALAWYEANGIKISCRRENIRYHNEQWPRRKKCKEGNLAYFHDHFGYDNYDIVIQMDADHVPQKGYLEHMLRPFQDPKVGYVAAPSICDSNEKTSWAARARMQAEAVFHGPIQSGTNDGWTPICIGSHYAVRTKALKQIGGIGPELAEDYSTTLLFNAYGWRGVWTYDAYAQGEGPNSFKDLIIQDYQWARSMTVLLVSFFPKFITKYSWKQRIQFVFNQLYYPAGALVWLTSILLPFVALWSGHAPVRVSFLEFIAYSSLPLLTTFAVYAFLLKKGHLRPKQVKLFSWEHALFEIARWPWVLIACVDGVYSAITKRTHAFAVTNKGKKASSLHLPFSILTPYLIVVGMALAILYTHPFPGELIGYYWFTQATALAYVALCAAVLALQIKETEQKQKRYVAWTQTPHVMLSLTLGILMVLVFISNTAPRSMSALAKITQVPFADSANIPISSPLLTASSTSNPIQYVEHVVASGECLWNISRHYYGYGHLWPEIKRPRETTLIYPGEIVQIPKEGGMVKQ